MNIRLYNAKILTMEEGRELFEGEIWIRDDTINYSGKCTGPDEIYDVLPG